MTNRKEFPLKGLTFGPKTANCYLGPATTQNLVVKFDGEICGGVLVENASDDFPQQKKLENLLPNFARKFATDFAENFANFTLEIAGA